jgi:hypothetical protein
MEGTQDTIDFLCHEVLRSFCFTHLLAWSHIHACVEFQSRAPLNSNAMHRSHIIQTPCSIFGSIFPNCSSVQKLHSHNAMHRYNSTQTIQQHRYYTSCYNTVKCTRDLVDQHILSKQSSRTLKTAVFHAFDSSSSVIATSSR